MQRLVADSGYWSIANVSAIPDAPELLIPPARHGRHGKPRKDGKPSESESDSPRAAMLARLGSEQGKACYAQRSRTIEPVFGQVKTIRAAVGSCAAACGVSGRMEAALRHPQPAQALARDHGHQQLTGTTHQTPPRMTGPISHIAVRTTRLANPCCQEPAPCNRFVHVNTSVLCYALPNQFVQTELQSGSCAQCP